MILTIILSLFASLSWGQTNPGNTAEPQFQLTGQNYSMEAAQIQQMFYNVTGSLQHINTGCFTNNTTSVQTPVSCPAGYALTGASYNSCGTQFGGSCTQITTSNICGITSQTSTATFTNLCKNQWNLVASTHPVAVSSVYFYNIVSTAPAGCLNTPRYRIEMQLQQNTAEGSFRVRYSSSPNTAADSTASNYSLINVGESQGGNLSNAGVVANFCGVEYVTDTAQIAVGETIFDNYYFWTKSGSNNVVYSHSDYTGSILNSTQYASVDYIGCRWPTGTNIGPINYVQLYDNAGTFTGDVTLWELCTQ